MAPCTACRAGAGRRRMTNPNAVVHPQSPGLLGDEAELFGQHNEHLVRSVRHAVCASDALIEDACSFAWMQLHALPAAARDRVRVAADGRDP